MGGQVRDHRRECSTEGAHRGGDAAASRRRRLGGRLAGKSRYAHPHQTLGFGLFGFVLHEVLYDLLLRIEGLEVVEGHRLDGNLDDFLLGDAEGALLLLEVELAGLDEDFLRHQADNLGAGDLQPAGRCGAADLFVGDMEGRRLDVGDVHRHLGDAVFVDVPADGLAAFQRSGDPELVAALVLEELAGQGAALTGLAALFADVEGHGHGTAGRCRIEVVIDGDKEVTGTDVCRAGLGGHFVPFPAEIGPAGGIAHLFLQGLILPCPADGEIAALGRESRGLVAVSRDAQLSKKALRQLACQGSAFF